MSNCVNCGKKMLSDTRYCDEICGLTWQIIQFSGLSGKLQRMLREAGIGFNLTDKQVEAVLERLKRIDNKFGNLENDLQPVRVNVTLIEREVDMGS